MQTIRITTSQNIDIDYEIAGLGERIVARLIDFGILVVIYIGVIVLGGSMPGEKTAFVALMIIICLFIAFYDLLCEVFFNGQSIGKRIMKIKVISIDGASPSLGQYLIRWIFRIIDFLITFQLGALLTVAATEKKQRIGDLAAGTTLVRTIPRTDFSHIAFAPVDYNYEPVFSDASNLKSAEIMLIHEVIKNFKTSDNYPLLYQTASRLKQHLNITAPPGMDDLTFLQTLIKDYILFASSEEA